MVIRVNMKGAREMLQALKQWRRVFPAALAAALFEEGQEWADDAVPRAPERSGFLKRSAFVTRPREEAKNPSVEFGFGADYSANVHARTSTSSGVPQWLEVTLTDRISGFSDRIVSKTRRFAESKRGVDSVAVRWAERPTAAAPSRGATPAGSRGRARRP